MLIKPVPDDRNSADIFNESPIRSGSDHMAARRAAKTNLAAPDNEVVITHPDRLMFPDAGISKAAVADYYRIIMPWFLPAIAARPLSVVRCPDGIGRQTFFQKHPGKGWGAHIYAATKTKSKGAEPYLYVEDAIGVLELIQMNVIEFHPWGSTVADLEHADATYRQTVLAAMEEVADTLRALETDARALQAQVEAEKAASDAFEISKKQFRVGGVSYVTVLNTQRLFLEARQSRVQAQAARYSDSAALFQALGGGWWNRKDEEVARK